MRKIQSLLFGAVLCMLASQASHAVEGTWEYAVQVSATAKTSPPQISLTWPQDIVNPVSSYTVYRKILNGTSWGTGTMLPGSATNYVDSNVTVGSAYEYQIVKVTSLYNGYGYVYAGINVPVIESRGKLVLLVDNTYASQLTNELARLQQDLTGDGWTVLRHDVSRNDTPPNIKAIIQADYNADPANVNAVFLFGHVPVPYSGDIVPDGHIPNHRGAWPADVYYGDMTGVWTDSTVNDNAADDPRNHNVPGDGKFDQSVIPSTVALMVGRVDLANLPGQQVWNGPATFPSELDLLRNYLNKDHNFRFNQMQIPRRGIVGDYFGIRNGEAFAASGWRNFAPFFGAGNVTSLPNQGTWIPTLSSNAYLWSYACGAGSFTSVGGIGNTGQYNDGTSTELMAADIKSVFTMLFGSWLGDWDSQDDIMRTVLALPSYGLTCAWSGRPHWFLQHMALGFPIGYSARLTQNNSASGLYQTQINSAAENIHIALMGDPTLRMHPVTPVNSVAANATSGGVNLSWSASTDSVVGYNVYRAAGPAGPFSRLNSSPVTTTSYTDAGASSGTYMVRAIKLETSASGTYYNPSQGAFANVGTVASIGGTTPPSTTGTTPPGSGNTNAATPPAGTTTTNITLPPTGNISISGSGVTVWVDDATPPNAQLQSAGGDTWNWISSNPAPFSGKLAHQSAIASGMHQHYFDWAGTTLFIPPGNDLFTYVYLDPANPPSEVMLEWNDGTWYHRAYWGANKINNGTNGTASQFYMGPLPAAGQWQPLIVPASVVNLDGSTLRGMSFTLCDGRATWDFTGTATPASINTNNVTTNTPPVTTTNTPVNTPTISSANTTVWVDDATPPNAQLQSAGGDTWDWISSNPAPFSGKLAHQSAIASGMHQHYFDWAGTTLFIPPGNDLFTYVYLDPANPPSEVMLEWNDGTWYHRAYWGANKINNGTNGTASQYYMGPMPAAGQWQPLIVPASLVNLDGSTLRGMSFTLCDGRATWDFTGTTAPSSINTNSSTVTTTTNTPPTTTPSTNSANTTVWVDDATPPNAQLQSAGGDTWNWISSNPAPFSGKLAHQSAIATGMHQHYFDWAGTTLFIPPGNDLFTYVYLDPANPPSEVMLEWNDGTWYHRAYWGANKINNGTNGTASQYYMGPMPAAGQWQPLIVPASVVNLDGSTLRGMSFTLCDGRATWDFTGTADPSSINTNTPPVTTTNTPTPPTSVTNTSPVLSAQSISMSNGKTTVNFNGTPGSQYNVQRSTNLVAWTTLATLTASSSGAFSYTDSFSDLGTVPASAYYRALLTTNDPPPVTTTNTSPIVFTNAAPPISPVDDTTLQMPQVGDNTMHILSPTTLELVLINSKQPDPAQVAQWNFVNSSGQLSAPSPSEFSVTVNGKPVAVQSVGFKRRPLYAPLNNYDLRIENSLYLNLASSIADNQNVVVQNPDGTLWASSMQFTNTANPLRFSPAIHVNQEGYVPSFPKQAMVGYYLGSMGEMSIPASAGFSLVDANTGAQVYQGTLSARPDVGWNYSPAPYQQVLMADFSNFTTPGQYLLVVPGYGASLPFTINDGIAMDFARGYALGLYHQRCGTSNSLPYTRFTHDPCHTAPASIPVPESNYAFTWKTIAGYSGGNTTQIAPQLTNQASSLFPFVNTGTVDVHGGHHDAGDYSKYTINVTSLIHFLMFAVDSIPGISSLDNLGIPESGDGISDVMQEAKWEADFLCRMQDADGGFYFLVYPQNREYESNVTPDHGDPQVVWPKNTSVTAASVAALAQCASSPKFKQQYPAEAALYLQKAQLGWKFLTNAIAKYGKNGAYQRITFYGDDYNDADELAWAACEMFLATGDPSIQQTLISWFNPSDPNTWRWGWWHMSECYGNAIRSFAFAVKSGRAQASQLDPTFLAKCQAEIATAANNALTWSQQTAYGTSFPQPTKQVNAAGWYFSGDLAFDLVVAYQLTPRSDYLTAILANVNYENGCNPINMSYAAGLGTKRQRTMVSQYQLNARHVLPPDGILGGNVQDGFPYLTEYQSELGGLCFPSDGATVAPYPFYDRWGDTWNVTTEMITLDVARSMVNMAFLGTLTSTKSQPYVAQGGTISVPAVVAAGVPVTATFQASNMDLTGARIVWEALGQEPAFGTNFTFTPTNNGAVWVEAEAQWPDGRRAFASTDSSATNGFPNVSVVATDASATKSTQDPATWTFTRTGDTSAPLTVFFGLTGTATMWNDYYRLPQGDMPQQLTFPAGSATATLTVYVNPISTISSPETATLNITENPLYNVGNPSSATITLNP